MNFNDDASCENVKVWLENYLRFYLTDDLCLHLDEKLNYVITIGDSIRIVFIKENTSLKYGSYLGILKWVNLIDHEYSDEILPAPGLLADFDDNIIVFENNVVICKYDFPRLVVWSLCRAEELDNELSTLDKHGRFKYENSIAYKHNLISIPYVDHWVLVIARIIKHRAPTINLNSFDYQVRLTHDVDVPELLSINSPIKSSVRVLRSFINKEISFGGLVKCVKNIRRSEINKFDPANTFDFIMELSESVGIRSAFYFICNNGNGRFDPSYSIKDKKIKILAKRILSRVHEVGLHYSYGSFLNNDALRKEIVELKKVIIESGGVWKKIGGRAHYLRWKYPDSLEQYGDTDLYYDSTLAYAEIPGFRAGTSREYLGFNIKNKTPINITIRPLVAMEGSVIAANYMNLGLTDESMSVFVNLSKECKKVCGTFSLLWHNSDLVSPLHKSFYSELVKRVVRP
jgi:hypothetical protein